MASSKVTQKPDTEALKALNDNITDEFRANAGKVGGRFEGNELLLLSTTGAKSGEPRVRRWWSSASTASCHPRSRATSQTTRTIPVFELRGTRSL